MQPIDIVERVKTTYKNYIKTAFPVIGDHLRPQMHARIEQANLLWPGPYPRSSALTNMPPKRSPSNVQHSTSMSAGAYVDTRGEQHPPSPCGAYGAGGASRLWAVAE